MTLQGEWWSWEICAGMAGTLGEVALAAHVSIQNFTFFYFPLPFSVSMAGTIRIGNLLGAGEPQLALLVTKVSLVVTNCVRKASARLLNLHDGFMCLVQCSRCILPLTG